MESLGSTIGKRRDEVLARIEDRLEFDGRVVAAWLSGSSGRGTADAWSDLDLHIVVKDAEAPAWLEQRSVFYDHLGKPIMILPGAVSERGDYQGVLFTGPVFLDLAVHRLSLARRDADTRLLFARVSIAEVAAADLSDADRRADLQHHAEFFWAMTPIALKYVARGTTHRAVTQCDLMAGAVARIWRVLHAPDRRDAGGTHWLHPGADADLITTLPRFGSTIDPQAALEIITRLIEAMRHLQPELAWAGASVSEAAIREVERFRDDIARALA